VAVPVVDGAEIVQVEHQEHKGVAESVGPLTLVRKAILEHPVTGDARKGVHGRSVEKLSLGGSVVLA
jgi:hypothetical protein